VLDLVFVLVVLAFFALASLFVTACERIVGRPELNVAPAEPDASEQVAA
jgi:hypothetical protein